MSTVLLRDIKLKAHKHSNSQRAIACWEACYVEKNEPEEDIAKQKLRKRKHASHCLVSFRENEVVAMCKAKTGAGVEQD